MLLHNSACDLILALILALVRRGFVLYYWYHPNIILVVGVMCYCYVFAASACCHFDILYHYTVVPVAYCRFVGMLVEICLMK